MSAEPTVNTKSAVVAVREMNRVARQVAANPEQPGS
jgi:hypothetical protein